MDDKYLQLLNKLLEGISQIESESWTTTANVQGLSKNYFETLILAYRSSLPKEKRQNLPPHDLNNSQYLKDLRASLTADTGSYQKSRGKSNYVAKNLPNLSLLVDDYQRYQERNKEEEKQKIQLAYSFTERQYESYKNNWLSAVKQAIQESLPSSVVLDDAKLTAAASKIIDEAFPGSKTIYTDRDVVIKFLSRDKIAEIAAEAGDPNINKGQLKEAMRQRAEAEIADQLIRIGTDNQLPAQREREVEIKNSWSEIRTALVSNLSSPVPPAILDHATANICYEMTNRSFTSQREFDAALQSSIQKTLGDKILKYSLSEDFRQDPSVVTAQIANEITPSINTIASRYVRGAPPENHSEIWQRVAFLPDHYLSEYAQSSARVLASRSPEEIISATSAGSGPSTGQPVQINLGAATGTAGGPAGSISGAPGTAVNLTGLQTSDPALQLFFASGYPLHNVLQIFDQNFDKKLENWVVKEGGPLGSGFRSVLKIFPGLLETDVISQFVLYNQQCEMFYREKLGALLGKYGDDDLHLSDAEFYDKYEAKRSLEILKKLKDFEDKHPRLFGSYRFLSKVFHPVQNWLKPSVLQSNKNLLHFLAAEALTTGLSVTGKYGMPGLNWFVESYTKMAGMAGVKWLAMKLTGGKLWAVDQSAPFGYKFYFVPWHNFKLKIRRGVWGFVEKRFAGVLKGKFVAFLASLGTGLGIASFAWNNFKKPVGYALGGLTLWLYSFLGPFAIPIMTGLIFGGIGALFWGLPGFFIGAGIGVIIGFGIVWGLKGFSFGGSGAGSAFYSPPYAQGAGAAAGTGLTGINLASNALIAPITIGGVGTLAVYTVMVTSSAFFIPSGDANVVGSPYIDLKKVANVGGLPEGSVIQNSVIGADQKVVYQITVSANGAALENVILSDKNTVFNKNSTSEIKNSERFLVTGKDANGKFIFGDKIPDQWNKSNTPSLAKIESGQSVIITYGFKLEDEARFKDSFVNNTATIKATVNGKEETKSITESFAIGNPPLPDTAKAAFALLQRLAACYPNPANHNEAIVNSANFGNGDCVRRTDLAPLGVSFKEATIQELKTSVSFGSAKVLQCIGFVQAVLAEAGTPFSTKGDANSFFGYNSDGFKWHSDLENIKTGDVFIARWSGWGGHAAIAVRNPGTDQFVLIEAEGYIEEPPKSQDPNEEPPEPNWIGLVHYPSFAYVIKDWDPKDYVGFLRYEP